MCVLYIFIHFFLLHVGFLFESCTVWNKLRRFAHTFCSINKKMKIRKKKFQQLTTAMQKAEGRTHNIAGHRHIHCTRMPPNAQKISETLIGKREREPTKEDQRSIAIEGMHRWNDKKRITRTRSFDDEFQWIIGAHRIYKIVASLIWDSEILFPHIFEVGWEFETRFEEQNAEISAMLMFSMCECK